MDVPASLQQRIDRRRFHAAPSRLRDAITAAARGGGLRVDVECGHENPADDRYVSPPVICEGCGAEYGPDESATKLMLRAADAL
jgi:hypothetical protein